VGCGGLLLGSHVRFACVDRDCADPMGSLSLLRGIVSPNVRGEKASSIPAGVVCDVGCLRRNVNLLV
jgi:hypothetical protein